MYIKTLAAQQGCRTQLLRRRFGYFWWPYGHADRWDRFPTWGFLLVFYSKHISKNTPSSSYGQTDKQRLRLMPGLSGGDMI